MLGTVKRDTIEDIGNSIVNSVKDVIGMDEDKGIIEDMKIEVIHLFISWRTYTEPDLYVSQTNQDTNEVS